MKVFINDKEYELKEGVHVEEIIKELKISTDGLILDINGVPGKYSDLKNKKVENNTKIELIRIVGGG